MVDRSYPPSAGGSGQRSAGTPMGWGENRGDERMRTEYRLTPDDEQRVIDAIRMRANDAFDWTTARRCGMYAIGCDERDLRDCELEWIDTAGRAAYDAVRAHWATVTHVGEVF